MLQTQTVSSELLELLNRIMFSDVFKNYVLVGGTSLALQIGHRNSIDIDMFGNQEIDEDLFVEELSKFGHVHVLRKSKNVFITTVNNIKVDFVNYKYPFIDEIRIIETIRIASKKEIAAMKLNAIAGRGSKKDFIDLFFLTKSYSLKEMMEFYTQKYNDGSEFMVLKSLTYFEDADQEQTPQMFNNFDWNYCKETIKNEFIKLNQ